MSFRFNLGNSHFFLANLQPFSCKFPTLNLKDVQEKSNKFTRLNHVNLQIFLEDVLF